MNKLSILAPALDGRNSELLCYQVNIDNYTLAIQKIDGDYSNNEDLAAFRDDLKQRLEEEKRQQLRCIILRDVIADQVAELQSAESEAP